MSELIDNSKHRKTELKKLILKLHGGESPEQVRRELVSTLKKIPYGEVVEVEQELIEEGLPEQEVLKLCDVHGEVLRGNVDLSSAREIPAGHPVDVFIHENRALLEVIKNAEDLFGSMGGLEESGFNDHLIRLQTCFNELMDVDKHYQRKEYLLFPYLEKNEITGPPKVMWGKHDEIREQLKGCLEILKTPGLTRKDLEDSLELIFHPALKALADMVQKEEEILFPMCMDVLAMEDWWSIHQQTLEIGFTLYDPQVDWKPEGFVADRPVSGPVPGNGNVQLPSGSFSVEEIMAMLNTVPFDMTFVDKDDKVKYFTQGTHRIFTRSRSILNRDVRLCHPPGSVHIVEKILEDFKSGKASRAPFWIRMKGMFIHIEYFALRNGEGEYLGTLEVSQDLTHLRKLEGERRILSYADIK
jgi:DUF438 domain-containing protein